MNEKIQTERLILRELGPGDAAALFAYRSHPRVAAFQSWKPASIDDANAFLAKLKLHPPYTGGTWRQLGITLRSDGSLIGDCGIHVMEDDSRMAEIAYTVAPEYQRQGYGSEAVGGVLTMLFDTLHVQRVVAHAPARNKASRALLDRLGFQTEKPGRLVLTAEDRAG